VSDRGTISQSPYQALPAPNVSLQINELLNPYFAAVCCNSGW